MRRASCKHSDAATKPALPDPAARAATSSSTSAAGRSRISPRGIVHHANLFDRVEPKTGIEPFGRLVEQVMTTEPYASARTVYWIVDNGSSHAGKTSIKRIQDRWPNARLIHLPVHASWLNQIELYFSIVQRKALTPNDLATLAQLAERLLSFGEHYRQIARPFEWTFTRQDLNNLIARIDRHEPQLALAA